MTVLVGVLASSMSSFYGLSLAHSSFISGSFLPVLKVPRLYPGALYASLCSQKHDIFEIYQSPYSFDDVILGGTPHRPASSPAHGGSMQVSGRCNACAAMPSSRTFPTCFKQFLLFPGQTGLHLLALLLLVSQLYLPQRTNSSARWEVLILYLLLQNTNHLQVGLECSPRASVLE